MKKGKLIVVEGGDGAGKATQAKLLLEHLSLSGKVSYFDFPQYGQTVFGDLIGKCLRGDFGDFVGLSPYLSSLPYILDRVSAKEKIISALEKGDVVCNRYTPSNICYQSAKLKGKQRSEFIKFLEKGEYEEIGLPCPDFVLYLEVPNPVATRLVEKKEKREYLKGRARGAKDQHESNRVYQEKVAGVYRELSKKRKEWKVISCVKNGKIFPPEIIHERILFALAK